MLRGLLFSFSFSSSTLVSVLFCTGIDADRLRIEYSRLRASWQRQGQSTGFSASHLLNRGALDKCSMVEPGAALMSRQLIPFRRNRCFS